MSHVKQSVSTFTKRALETFPYSVQKGSYSIIDCMKWLCENFGPDGAPDIESPMDANYRWTYIDGGMFFFRESEDAVHFALLFK